MKILIATKNPGKAREMKVFLGDGFEIISLTDIPDATEFLDGLKHRQETTPIPDIEENGNTFEENVLLKSEVLF